MSLAEDCCMDFPQTEMLALARGGGVCWWVPGGAVWFNWLC